MKKSCLNEVLYNSRGQPKLSITDTESESFADVQTALSHYLNQSSPPGAIFGCNGQITYASILLLRDKGYNVPQDERVMRFNGFEVHRHLIPNLTTVFPSAYEMSQIEGESMLSYFSTGYLPNSDTTLSVKISLGVTT